LRHGRNLLLFHGSGVGGDDSRPGATLLCPHLDGGEKKSNDKKSSTGIQSHMFFPESQIKSRLVGGRQALA